MDAAKDIRLIVEINNKKPLELLDLTKSLVALANQFNSYVSKEGESKEAKLFVKEIKTGSVILELVEFTSAAILPFAENVNTVVGFADFLKKAYNFLLGKSKDKPTEFTHNDYRDLSQILNPIATDSASQINISTAIHGDVNLYLKIDSTEANAAQNIIEKLDKELKRAQITEGIRTKVLLTLFQTRADTKATVGNKGTIEDITTKPLNLIFDTEEINKQMLHDENINPNDKIFVVDVELQHVGGKLAAYKIIKFHQIFDKE